MDYGTKEPAWEAELDGKLQQCRGSLDHFLPRLTDRKSERRYPRNDRLQIACM